MTSIKFRALTHDDHKLFFEAIGEYGKDFQNIQQYMTQKGNKNKSENNNNRSLDPQEKREQDKKEEDKKREQIRNFYNKLYTKLSQLVGKLDDRVEKVNQELYLLINYGEIWKKHGFIFNNKTKRLLEELLYHGSTTLRFKNKNVRLRTPSCRALKRINEIGVDEKVKVVTTRELPKDVVIEFHPATNRDWLQVQSISQNPRVRARLSIQKRLSNILDFLENKWGISQEKTTRTVDAWLKLDSKSQQSINHDDLTLQQPHLTPSNNGSSAPNYTPNTNSNCLHINSSGDNNPACDIHQRLRLKTSNHHELKEINITRVVPDNHLDLSLTAYIKRLGETKPSTANSNCSSQTKSNPVPDETKRQICSVSQLDSGNSRLHVSLTTPDCSILFEKSCTSDQPSIAQARKHLNLLQTLIPLDGCENSRTVCEDTQDRSLHSILNHVNGGNHGAMKSVCFARENDDSQQPMIVAPTVLVNNDIPALYDEDAALPTVPSKAPVTPARERTNNEAGSSSQHLSMDSQNSKSVGFSLPTNVTLGDYFKMANEKVEEQTTVINNDETANDAFPIVTENIESKPTEANPPPQVNQDQQGSSKDCLTNTQNLLVDIKRLAEGWTRFDNATMTVGELYLALNCPDKIILEYNFEQSSCEDVQTSNVNIMIDGANQLESRCVNVRPIYEKPSHSSMIFKLLTAASISLAQIEHQKQDQQQTCSKLKRRKMAPVGQVHNTMTPHDIETTNQRVEEALKQLQPTRLCGFRRAR